MIEIVDINKTYLLGEQPLQVLKDVSLTIAQGDYLSIMGPSGSGKSTLLNMLGLLDRPDNGEYFIEQIATRAISEEKRAQLRQQYIGFIFQSFHLIPRLTAQENAELPLMIANISLKERRAKVAAVFAELGIKDRANHLPKELSGGQLQRVAIARAMVTEPKILLADEPTGNLDQKSGHEVIALLEQLNQRGITLAMVTHDKALGMRATRQLNMVDGVLSEVRQTNSILKGE